MNNNNCNNNNNNNKLSAVRGQLTPAFIINY